MASTNDTDFYEELWVKNLDVAESTLKTPFLQHMQLGDLPVDSYVKFFLQDIIYVWQVRDVFKRLSETVQDEEVRQFMEDRYKSVKKYADNMPNEFNIKPEIVSNITPTPAMKKCVSDYEDMNNMEPIFFAVAVLSGVRLWNYLGNQLIETCSNPYFTWKTKNMKFHPEKFRELLNKCLTKEEDKKKAHDVFHQHIQFEHEIFASSLVK